MPRALPILPEPPPPPTAIGLIAGGGRLPVMVARGLRDAGHPVHGLGLARCYAPELPSLCASFRDVGLFRIGTWARLLTRHGVRHAIMVGRVDKASVMHDPLRFVRNIPDWRTARMLYRHKTSDRGYGRSHALLKTVADELERAGVQLLDSTVPIRNELASAGVMTRLAPTPTQRGDIEFAWPMLMQLLGLDVGQALAVRERDVLAVEAVEGTDRMIERVGPLCKAGGWTLCKGARIGHDRRSDVPTVGETTIRKLHEHGAGCLAVAADDVIMIDRPSTLDLADQLGITVVGIPVAGPSGPAVFSVEAR